MNPKKLYHTQFAIMIVTDTLVFVPASLRPLSTIQKRLKSQQGNRGDIRKMHVTRQFFEAKDPQGLFSEKQKTRF